MDDVFKGRPKLFMCFPRYYRLQRVKYFRKSSEQEAWDFKTWFYFLIWKNCLRSKDTMCPRSCPHFGLVLPAFDFLMTQNEPFTMRTKLTVVFSSLFVSGRKTYWYRGLYRPPPRRMLGRPIRKFRSRLFARRRCEKIARSGRYRAYALQYGRYCYVARLTSTKFTRYGRSVSKRPSALKVFIRTRGRIFNK